MIYNLIILMVFIIIGSVNAMENDYENGEGMIHLTSNTGGFHNDQGRIHGEDPSQDDFDEQYDNNRNLIKNGPPPKKEPKLPDTTLQGLCRWREYRQRPNRDWMVVRKNNFGDVEPFVNEIKCIRTKDVSECLKECHDYENKNENIKCTAFNYGTTPTPGLTGNNYCTLYSNGPYTFAKTFKGTTCYLMRRDKDGEEAMRNNPEEKKFFGPKYVYLKRKKYIK